MKLLSVIGTLDPAYGGPVESLRQFSACIGQFGHAHETLTLDSPNCEWLSEFPGPVHAIGPSVGRYRYNFRLRRWLSEHIAGYDAVIVRGIWQYHSFAVWRALRNRDVPYFVFVHGALDPWFRYHYPLKHLKKWLYWPWAEYLVLRRASRVLFTSEEERRLAAKSFWLYRADEAVVDYGICGPGGDLNAGRDAFLEAHPHLRGKRVLLFLSRIHAKKGCDLLVQAFAEASQRDSALHLVMAGPDQEGWARELVSLSRSLGVDSRITWTGMLKGNMKLGAFQVAEAFVLPSHSENFGIVVAEALACGLPVLITDKVNIWRQIEADGAGLVDADTLDGVRNLMTKWLEMPEGVRKRMAKRATTCFANHFEIHQAVRTLLNVIEPQVVKE